MLMSLYFLQTPHSLPSHPARPPPGGPVPLPMRLGIALELGLDR